MLTRRSFAAASAAALVPSPLLAQSRYPVPTVTLVTHSSPGGGSDVFLRELIKHLHPVMGVNFAVENVRGGSGATAVARVARARPDGSMFYATTPTYIQTTLLSRPEFGYDALDPLAIVFLDPEVIYTRTESPFRTLADAVAHARANPGRQKWGAANPASLERIAFERMNRLTGARAAVVSHEGGGDLMINVLNGTLDLGIGEIQEIRSQLEAGRIRLLAVVTEARLPDFPDLATAREQGVDLVVTKFRGLAGPKGIPDEVAAIWHEALRRVLESPAYKAQYAKESLVPSLMARDEARRFTTAFAAEVERDLRELGVVR
ncbi:tripartite tricarboxylate transporter substrate binding protein [Elioraea sp.]|jgi:tripartite-type tricarboxylate transporter receptor subunit TctC|uniref:tripartite tricarboxylate transporter substrate binding protein n=1 Tax=Elioraea sp. TaxID=2185103 RepID=UPI0021DBB0AB|nr:tripartite tricarboxylate transporter substrate binding protein [Elioraea sp.]GIX08584.1 MAG: LacI family transcriptional regulator [Elioraea sp.]